MKRMLFIFTIVMLSLTVQPGAVAERAYFGVHAEGVVPMGLSGSLVIPLFGVQVGYDFGAQSDPGLRVRVSLSSLVILNRLSLDALYRSPSNEGWYVGAGGDVLLFSFVGAESGVVLGAHGVAGFDIPLSDFAAIFVELWPLALPLLHWSLVVGINFYV
jgi:hypothetical protein